MTIAVRHTAYRIDSVFVWQNSDVIRLYSGVVYVPSLSRDVFAQIYVPILRLYGTEQTFVWYNFKLVRFRRRTKTCTDK